jgi:hypothetical protein
MTWSLVDPWLLIGSGWERRVEHGGPQQEKILLSLMGLLYGWDLSWCSMDQCGHIHIQNGGKQQRENWESWNDLSVPVCAVWKKSDEICRDQFPNHRATMCDVLSLDHVSENKFNSPSAVSLVWCCALKFIVYGVSHAVVSTILKWLIILPSNKLYMGRSHWFAWRGFLAGNLYLEKWLQ